MHSKRTMATICVDDGGKVQGEPNESVDPTHLDGRSE